MRLLNTDRKHILKKWAHNNDATLNQYIICIMDFWKNDLYGFGDVLEIVNEHFHDKVMLVDSIETSENDSFATHNPINPAVRDYSIYIAALKI